eukprot:5200598-Pyramimonas_sp.AAC.1
MASCFLSQTPGPQGPRAPERPPERTWLLYFLLLHLIDIWGSGIGQKRTCRWRHICDGMARRESARVPEDAVYLSGMPHSAIQYCVKPI